ncbi:DNA N-6-adenine-methyltransferase [Proteiniphilum sp. UBA5346]|uniref:DNA N-6-adenine-methyltransferase n=1 Tax=Proteiniphilum sp. UBA5346 TaxID=1947277 RepID=UPI00257ED1B5|nr:DNA N-6-adenine-methyltransferase [Proteiniphilum sp. UBA5346]
MNIIESDEWYTPPEIISSLGEFDLDPATSPDAYKLNRSADDFYTATENGLIRAWSGRNPPYSNPLLQEFLNKMAVHNRGTALIYSKIDAKWFHDIVLNNGTAIKFLYDRIRFLKPDRTKGMHPRGSSMLVAYGREDAKILSGNTLKGEFVYL